MFERITFDPQIMGGRACIRGMRIPVSVIVGQLAHGATAAEILANYPDLERESRVEDSMDELTFLDLPNRIDPSRHPEWEKLSKY